MSAQLCRMIRMWNAWKGKTGSRETVEKTYSLVAESPACSTQHSDSLLGQERLLKLDRDLEGHVVVVLNKGMIPPGVGSRKIVAQHTEGAQKRETLAYNRVWKET